MKKRFGRLALLVACLGVPLLVEWLTTPAPRTREIAIEAFRYGTSPSTIRANRGDELILSLSTRDTGHSFFLQEYGIDAKIFPSAGRVELFDPFHPSAPTTFARDVRIRAGRPGFWGSLFSLSRFRCHVYCGRMHGFEQGSLIVRPNWLFAMSMGLVFYFLIAGYIRARRGDMKPAKPDKAIDLNKRSRLLDRTLKIRSLPFLMTLPVLGAFLLIILAGLLGTKVGGRNIAVMLTWATWMCLLTIFLVPVGGRVWCFICPLAAPGEYLQRGLTTDVRFSRAAGKNRYFGLNLPWPKALSSPWLRTIAFLVVGSFSASLAGQPKWTAIVLLLFFFVATVASLVFSRRAFCRYLCPVSTFLSLYSPAGRLQVRARDIEVCAKCREKACYAGNENGWACPYGLVVPAVRRNMDCGLCAECFKSCPYDNVQLGWRTGPMTNVFKNTGEAFQAVAMFTLAIAYSLTIHNSNPRMRDLVNVVDKATWLQFGAYVLVLWLASLVAMPALVKGLTRWGVKRARLEIAAGPAFRTMALSLIPLGLSLWAAFFVAMFLSDFTFILVTLSDPFGWGWDIFGTARLPWIQVWPQAVPWIQSGVILAGLFFSLRFGYRNWLERSPEPGRARRAFGPFAVFLATVAAAMAAYFTNF